MKMLDFKLGKMIIRHFDILMSFERFMPNKAQEINESVKARRNQTIDYEPHKLIEKPVPPKRKRPVLPRHQNVPKFSLCSKMKETKLSAYVYHY